MSRIEARDAGQIHCPCFEVIRVDVRLKRGYGVDAGAADAGGRKIQILPHDYAADAHRTEKALVAGESQDVDAHCFHVDTQNSGALTRVDHENSPGCSGNFSNCLDVLHRPKHVGSMIDDDYLGLAGDRAANLFRVDVALRVTAYMSDGDTAVALQMLNRAQHRVVLQTRSDNVVSFTQKSEQHDVQGIGCVLGEYHPFAITAVVKKRRQQAAGFGNHFLGFDRQLVAGATGIDAKTPEERIHGAVDDVRLGPGGGRIVEVVMVFDGSSPLLEDSGPGPPQATRAFEESA